MTRMKLRSAAAVAFLMPPLALASVDEADFSLVD
jgi:hypothetical protein